MFSSASCLGNVFCLQGCTWLTCLKQAILSMQTVQQASAKLSAFLAKTKKDPRQRQDGTKKFEAHTSSQSFGNEMLSEEQVWAARQKMVEIATKVVCHPIYLRMR